MKKLKITFLFLTILLKTSFSQQDPVSSHYMYNSMTYNPGIAGSSGMICATALSRQQWVGFKGAPSTNVFTINAPVTLFGINSGVGLKIESDKTGFDKDINLSGTYSYLMDLGTGTLGIGISAGILNKALSPDWQIPTGDSHIPASSDPLIPENDESYVSFDADLGVYYSTEKYYGGFSVTHINEPKIKYTKGLTYISRHFYLTGGYVLQLPNPSLELLPSFLVFTDGKVAQFTLNSLVRYNKKAWGGVSYRMGDALTGMIGFELFNGIRIGYAYDFPISDIRKSTSGSHEFMVNYCFDLSLGKSPMKYKSIRFL